MSTDRQSALNRPSACYAPAQSYGMNTSCFCPICKHHRLTVMGNPDVVSFVPGLFGDGAPSAVRRGIRPATIHSVDAVSRRWASTHIGQEALEGRPLRADCDSSAAISGIGLVLRVQATIPKARPDAILGNLFTEAVNPECVPGPFSMQTPTRLGAPPPEIIAINRDNGSTRTSTQPLDPPGARPLGVFGDYGQSTVGQDNRDGRLTRHRGDLPSIRGVRPSPVDAVRRPLAFNYTRCRPQNDEST